MIFALPVVALLAAVSQVQAHAFISPGLGVAGTGVRNDVQRPSTAAPCGKASLADIDSSTAIPAVNGVFNAVVTNFNAGKDGSTQITAATVDTTGTGKSFTGQVAVTTNGVAAPTSVGSVPITLSLPAGTACTGGAAGNLCLVSMTTAGKFGNCVVVSTGAASTGAATAGTNTTTTDPAAVVGANTTVADPAVVVASNTTSTTLPPTDTTGNSTTTTTTGTGKGGRKGKGTKAAKEAAKAAKAAAAAGGAAAPPAAAVPPASAAPAGVADPAAAPAVPAANAAAGKGNKGGKGAAAVAGAATKRAHPRDWLARLWADDDSA